MKPLKISITGILALLLALALVLSGLWLLYDGEIGALFQLNGPAAQKLTAASVLMTLGICVGVSLLQHLLRPRLHTNDEMKQLQTKIKAMEALNEKTQRLAHHQRLEMLGTLTSSIAHEFNNFLTPIMGYSLMALEKLPPEEEELYDSLVEIYNASRQAKTIISRLSDLSRKNSETTFHFVAPDELVQKTLEVATPAKPKNVEIRLNLNCWDQRITANEIQLSQLLLNLILNGFHAMEGRGGELTVDTSFDDTAIYIRVADTGRGIPENIRSRIFEPFFTTKETGRGTGLGLAIVAQVVEDHHGSIQVDSEQDKGTAFTVKLPRDGGHQ